MLYKPNYCCHCGESVERIEWKLWTSRRFCVNCESVFRKEDWISKIVIVLAVIFGLFGFGSYLKTPEKPLKLTSNELISSASNKGQTIKHEQIISSQNNANSLKNMNVSAESDSQVYLQASPKKEKTTIVANLQNDAMETVYFCGAQTKKGTPCSRKVKGNTRCWQHQGLPAMLPKEKLIVSQ